MAMAVTDRRVSREEYLEGELVSEIKHEYVAGNVYAMSGGSWEHGQLAVNFIRSAGNQLEGKPCKPMGSDFSVRVPLSERDDAFYYPDGLIQCSPIPPKSQYTDAPTVILEVLSPSTRRNDETLKLRDYLTIPELRVYIMAEVDSPLLVLYRREGEGFRREVLAGLDAVLELPEVGLSIPLAELYRDVV